MTHLPAKETSQQKLSALPDSWIAALFNKLAAYYGNRFTDMWRGVDIETVRKTWAEKLVVYSPEALTYALEQCETHDWPPSLPEFVKLCKVHASRLPAYRALPEPPIDKATAAVRLRQACEKAGIPLSSIVKGM
jgi:hypothetical protein